MKKTNFNLKLSGILFLLSAVMFYWGCGPDEDPVPPTITVSPETTQDAWKGDTVNYSVVMGSNEELTSYTISPNIAGKNSDASISTTLTGNNSTISYKYVVDSALVVEGNTVTITFTVTDKASQTASASRVINITEKKIQLVQEADSGLVWNVSGPKKGAWDLAGDSAVSASSSELVKDVKDTSSPTTFTPSWIPGTGNNSTYVRTTTYDWDNATDVSARNAYNAGLAKSTTGSLSVGDYVIVKIRGGNDYVVIKVVQVDVTTADNLDFVKFIYKKKL